MNTIRGLDYTDLDELKELETADEETIREFEMEHFVESGILPLRVTETGDEEDPLSEVIICSAMSDVIETSKMPKTITLMRRLADGTEITGEYILQQSPGEQSQECSPKENVHPEDDIAYEDGC